MFTSNHTTKTWGRTEFERIRRGTRDGVVDLHAAQRAAARLYRTGDGVLRVPSRKTLSPRGNATGYLDFYAALIRLRPREPGARSRGTRRAGRIPARRTNTRRPDAAFPRTAGGNEVTVAANQCGGGRILDLLFEGLAREFFTRRNTRAAPAPCFPHGSGWSSHKTGDKSCGHAGGCGNKCWKPAGN